MKARKHLVTVVKILDTASRYYQHRAFRDHSTKIEVEDLSSYHLPILGALQDAVPQVIVLTPDTSVRTRLLQSATV